MSKGEDSKPQITPGDDSQGDVSDDGVVSIDHSAPEEETTETTENAEPHDIFETAEEAEEIAEESAPEATEASAEAPQAEELAPAPEAEQPSPFDSKTATGTTNYSQRRSGGRRDFSNADANTGMQTPQFFNDAMIASAPASQPPSSFSS